MSNCELLHALLTRLVSYRSFLIPQLFQPTSSICKLYLPKIDTGWYHFFLMYKVCIATALPGTCSLPTGPSHACNLHDCISNTFNKYTNASLPYTAVDFQTKYIYDNIYFILTCSLKSSLVKFGCFFAMVVCSPPVWITTSIINILWSSKTPIKYHVKKISSKSHQLT